MSTNSHLIAAVSAANKALPAMLAEAHAHDLTAGRQFDPPALTADGAREALYWIERVRKHLPQRAQEISTLRHDLVAVLQVDGSGTTPDHPHAAMHAREEAIARAARVVTAQLGVQHCSAPIDHAKKVVKGVEVTLDAADAWELSDQSDPQVIADFLVAISNDLAKRGHDGRSHAVHAVHAQLRKACS